jgi:hypothetical protein
MHAARLMLIIAIANTCTELAPVTGHVYLITPPLLAFVRMNYDTNQHGNDVICYHTLVRS